MKNTKIEKVSSFLIFESIPSNAVLYHKIRSLLDCSLQFVGTLFDYKIYISENTNVIINFEFYRFAVIVLYRDIGFPFHHNILSQKVILEKLL